MHLTSKLKLPTLWIDILLLVWINSHSLTSPLYIWMDLGYYIQILNSNLQMCSPDFPEYLLSSLQWVYSWTWWFHILTKHFYVSWMNSPLAMWCPHFCNSRPLSSFDTRRSLTPTALHKLQLSLDLLIHFLQIISNLCSWTLDTWYNCLEIYICPEAYSWSMNTLRTGCLHSMQTSWIRLIWTAKF